MKATNRLPGSVVSTSSRRRASRFLLEPVTHGVLAVFQQAGVAPARADAAPLLEVIISRVGENAGPDARTSR